MDKILKENQQNKRLNLSSKKITALTFLTALEISSCVTGKHQKLTPQKLTPEYYSNLIDIETLNEAKKQEIQKATYLVISSENAKLQRQKDLYKAINKHNWQKLMQIFQDPSTDPNKVGHGLTSLVLAGKSQWTNSLFDRHSHLLNFEWKKVAKCECSKKIFGFLLSRERIDIRTPDPKSGLTPLHIAIINEWIPETRTLIKELYKRDLSVQDYSEGVTPLHLAILFNLEDDIIRSLIHKVDAKGLALKDKYGMTPLLLAIKCKSSKAHISALINKMSVDDLSLRDKNNKSPLYKALQDRNMSAAKLLVNKLPSDEITKALALALRYNPSQLFSHSKNHDIVNFLLNNITCDSQSESEKKKVDRKHLCIKDKEQNSLLHLAMQCGEMRAINFLITNLPEKALSHPGPNRATPLHLAIQLKLTDAIKSLLARLPQEDLGRTDSHDLKPLDLAVLYNDIETVKLLITKLPSKDLVDALILGMQARHKKIVDCLLTKGKIQERDLSIKDKEGKTLLHLAIQSDDIDAFTFLASKLPLEDLFARDNNGREPMEHILRKNKKEAFKCLFTRIKNERDRAFLTKRFFNPNEYGHSLFASAYLDKNKFVGDLCKNSKLKGRNLLPNALSNNYKMFAYMIQTLSSALTFDEYMTIVQEIDNLEEAHQISKNYARYLRCLLKPYIEAKALESGKNISRSGYKNKKEKLSLYASDSQLNGSDSGIFDDSRSSSLRSEAFDSSESSDDSEWDE